jgi:hypothetical protein
MKAKTSSILPATYAPLLADLKARVRAAQVKAAVSVNRELILLYWYIGREILRSQKAEGWGTKMIERLDVTFLGTPIPSVRAAHGPWDTRARCHRR